MKNTKYRTKPLDSWLKAKELRLDHYKDLTTAREQGKLLVTGSANTFMSLLAGFGDFVFFSGEPYGASVSYDARFALECGEATEARGFARDMCSYMRNYWGSMYLDRFYFGGPFPKPDFCYTRHICDSHAKWFQVVSEHYDVPIFAIDMPPYSYGEDADRMKLEVDYVVAQAQESIENVERLTGRKFDDDKFLSALENEFRTTALWGEIALLNEAIPAPLDLKTMFSLYVLPFFIKHEKRSVDYFTMLRDEVKDRIANQIAAVGNERCRLMHDSQPPWFFLRIFRYLEERGVVCVGSHYSLGLTGTYVEGPDGQLFPKKVPQDEGVVYRNREEALRAMVLWYLDWPMEGCFIPHVKNYQVVDLARYWHCDGVLLHLNRGCEGTACGQLENRLALVNAGIPTMAYEGNMADEREFDETQVLDRVDAFLESLGVSKQGD
ncbi:MAG: benzoyl-CoA reductase, bzd-type, subunit O [Dehalococcoidia bacterium]